MEEREYSMLHENSMRQEIERVVEDIRAAAHLNLPFRVTTIQTKSFVHGNVSKSTVWKYRVEFGEDMMVHE